MVLNKRNRWWDPLFTHRGHRRAGVKGDGGGAIALPPGPRVSPAEVVRLSLLAIEETRQKEENLVEARWAEEKARAQQPGGWLWRGG